MGETLQFFLSHQTLKIIKTKTFSQNYLNSQKTE